MPRPPLAPRRLAPPLLLLLLLFLGALAGCGGGSAALADVWADPAPPTPPPGNILVIAVRREAGPRRLWEDAVAGGLAARGVTATPSYRLFPDSVPDTAQVISAVQRERYDGVFVSYRPTRATATVQVPGHYETRPATYWGPWVRSYYTYWRDVYYPSYTVTSERVRTRNELWATAPRARLLWTARSEAVDPSSTSETAKAVAKAVVGDLAKKGLVAAR